MIDMTATLDKPKRRGRPPGSGAGITARLDLRATPAELADWNAAATAAGETLAQWIRDRLNNSAKRTAK